VSGKPTTPEDGGAADGQFSATNVCHAKFHQSFCDAFFPLLTSAGTTHELGGSAVALGSGAVAGGVDSDFWLHPELSMIQNNAPNNLVWMDIFCMVQ
jgi:hypothetical protein